MLNRASRIAAALTYTNPAAHPTLPSSDSPHANASTRRRQTERDDVGERIELDAERARRVGHPRDAAVEHVEDERDADERRRQLTNSPRIA